ncbi:MAG: TolC family protein [Phycisphaerales bacterium]
MQTVGNSGGVGSRALAGVLLVLAGGACGCTDNLADVDARTAELIERRSGLLGPSSRVPRREFGEATDADAAAKAKVPGSVNPATEELSFVAADEARDVAARLEAFSRPPPDAVRLDLQGSWRQAQRSAREYLSAEEEYILAAIRLLIERHAFDPRFFATATAAVDKTDTPGDAREQVPLSIMGNLGVVQRFENGADVAARWVWDATEELRTSATGRYTQSSSLVLSGNLPLLRGAGDVARADLIQAERELVYAARAFEDFRRTYLVSIARDYFTLAQQVAQIRNQERQLASLVDLQERTRALVEAGRLAEFETAIAASQVLQGRSTLASVRESFILALDRFKVRLGMDVNQPVVLEAVALQLPEPEILPEVASAMALDFRLDLQTRRDRFEDARRNVEFARNSLLPDANLFGSVTARTRPASGADGAPREGGFVYEPDDVVYRGGIAVSVPLDKEIERLNVRAATIGVEQRRRDVEQTRDTIIVEVRSRVRQIDRARFALTLAEQAVQINQRRLEEQELKRDEVTAQQIVDTNNVLLGAENARDQAVTDLRNAILDYLVSTATLRVARDGTLESLPGMGDVNAPDPVPAAGDAAQP